VPVTRSKLSNRGNHDRPIKAKAFLEKIKGYHFERFDRGNWKQELRLLLFPSIGKLVSSMTTGSSKNPTKTIETKLRSAAA
jgi:hypothetical protein